MFQSTAATNVGFPEDVYNELLPNQLCKPKRIILIRHEQSAGNVDESLYTRIPDWRIPLTDAGRDHGRLITSQQVRDIIQDEPVYFYASPYERTLETCRLIIEHGMTSDQVIGMREEPRMVEQQFGNFQNEEIMRQAKIERALYGSFFYRFPNGESGLDVYNRAATFINTLFRDFCNPRINFNPDYNIVIVTHGLTLRLFLMRWFQFSVKEFEDTVNPSNGGIVVMERKSCANINNNNGLQNHPNDDVQDYNNKDGKNSTDEASSSRSVYYEINEETRIRLNLPDHSQKI